MKDTRPGIQYSISTYPRFVGTAGQFFIHLTWVLVVVIHAQQAIAINHTALQANSTIPDQTIDHQSIQNLIQALDNREPLIREMAIQRLSRYSQCIAGSIADRFAHGTLASRLSAMQILDIWKAPLGDMDPWRPETMTENKLRRLRQWAVQQSQIRVAKETTEYNQWLLDSFDRADSQKREIILRNLRLAHNEAGLRCLIALTQHKNWQIRAKAVEIIGRCMFEGRHLSSPVKDKARSVLIKLLYDPDAFVVKQAVVGLRETGAAAAIKPLWGLLRQANTTMETAEEILETLRRLYFGNQYANPSRVPADKRKIIADELLPKIQSGPEQQRLVGLALLLSASVDQTINTATSLLNNKQSSPTIYQAAFQVLLLSQANPENRHTAIEALSDPSVDIRKIALHFLTIGKRRLNKQYASGFHLYPLIVDRKMHSDIGPGKPVQIEIPQDLSVESLKAMLKDPDPQIAAYAGYLLVLLGKDYGLEPLIRYWKEQAYHHPVWIRLAYRAMSLLGDDAHMPVLEEIYNNFDKDDPQIREFYWTIQLLKKPKIQPLLDRIRAEIGPERLD